MLKFQGERLIPWLLVRAQSCREQVVRDALEYNGAEVYLPLTECICVRSRRQEIVQRPFFPGYVFVRQGKMDLRGIKATVYVRDFVTTGRVPVAVSARIVDAIRARADERGFIQLPDTMPKRHEYKKGDQVQVTQGPFTGMNAIFQSSSGAMRVRLLLQTAISWQKVMMPYDQIAPAISA